MTQEINNFITKDDITETSGHDKTTRKPRRISNRLLIRILPTRSPTPVWPIATTCCHLTEYFRQRNLSQREERPRGERWNWMTDWPKHRHHWPMSSINTTMIGGKLKTNSSAPSN